MNELAARAGVTVRTVRFYGAKGLLPPPVIGARRAGGATAKSVPPASR